MSRQNSKLTVEPLVKITRGSLVEAIHRGFIAAIDVNGQIVAQLGEIETLTWFRSAAKPFQTIPIITSGAADHFKLTSKELAVITASHSGEAIHLEVVNSILKKVLLTESDLLCGAHAPFDEPSAHKLTEENIQPRQLHNNCSGKHSGMLALAKFLGKPTADYTNPQHQIQQRILNVLAEFVQVPPNEVAIAIDGCSAPVFGVSLLAMAKSYSRLVNARSTDLAPHLVIAAEKVIEAMTEFPEMVGGSRGRLDTDLMRVTQGQVVSKVGAEGVQLLGVKPCQQFPNGLGIAIKIEDGDTRRARDPVVIETLRQLGVLSQAQVESLAAYTTTTLLNHRKLEVGQIRTCFKL